VPGPPSLKRGGGRKGVFGPPSPLANAGSLTRLARGSVSPKRRIFAVACALLAVANFYEKAPVVKSRRGGSLVAYATALCPSRAMLLSALSVSALSSVALCI
jgi:hypothetical protein